MGGREGLSGWEDAGGGRGEAGERMSSILYRFCSPQNLIAQSQSGTGKTAAFVLAMLTRVDPSKPYPQVINN